MNLTEKEKEKLLAYLIRISLQADSEVSYALSACQAESSVYISERLVRATLTQRLVNKITHDIYSLLEI